MSRFVEAKRLQHIQAVDQRMSQASMHLDGFCQSVLDVAANWHGYLQTEGDDDQVLAARVEFADRTKVMVDEKAVAMAAAFDVIAFGMRNDDGEPLTRAELLAKIAAVQ